ncbi:transposase family protein [Actinomadura darangshiensis]|uniref:Transposase family protein n=1 Tax=Actinomadura darangshiensis TaxID=705336 RepID=A0A4R5C4E1_9ACTN|nr:transposase family protein [Actinomadura darangshiensis]
MMFYRAALDLSPSARGFVAGLVRRHRTELGSRWRRLPPGRQALLVLVYLRRNETFARLAAEFGVGVATAHRYVTEVIDLLAELAPDLRQALRIARRKAYVVLDGTLAPIDRLSGAGDRLSNGDAVTFAAGSVAFGWSSAQLRAGDVGELPWALIPFANARKPSWPDRRVSPKERSRWRFTFQRLVKDARRRSVPST